MTKKPPKPGLESEKKKNQSRMQLSNLISQCLPPSDDESPVLLMLAGPNGSGKTTFHQLIEPQLKGIPFVNADVLNQAIDEAPASELLAQKISDLMRWHYIEQKASFVTETVFSDEVGSKLGMMKKAQELGFRVVLVYIAIPSVKLSKLRVAGRVQNGGHNVPAEKLERRYNSSLANLANALETVDYGIVVENAGDITGGSSFTPMAFVAAGTVRQVSEKVPQYIAERLPKSSQRQSKN